jgi:tRNA A37 threonylcarbamoyladenosine dehydratase
LSNLGRFSRTELLLGENGMKKLAEATVAVFGVGGVGSFVAEGLARAGVGHLVLIDNDLICLTNINRQIHATTKTIGKPKTQVMKDRILDINPQAVVDTIEDFYLPDNAAKFFQQHYDYVVDAIDTVTGKINLVLQCRELHIPIICSMGAGNKLDPTKFEVTDIYKTSVDPIARVMRKKMKEHHVKKLKVVYSKEKPLAVSPGGCGKNCVCPPGSANNCAAKRAVPGSISFVPSVVGLIIAGEVVRGLTGAKVEVSA